MKLYYSKGACSLAPHILLRDTGLPFTLARVDTATHKTDDGVDYYTINPKGYVPLLELDGGERLTEGPVVCQYICDRAGRLDLMPAAGTLPRYRVMEWQGYVNSELHKPFGILFDPAAEQSIKHAFRLALRKKYEWVNTQLERTDYLTGAAFTAADAYLYTVTRWAKYTQLDLDALAGIQAFMQRTGSRPTVRDSLHAEGIRA